jgi:SpoIID/LytB domain protein
MSSSTILRVQISKGSPYTCVLSGGVTSVGGFGLSTAGVTRFRLIPSGSGLAAQKTSGNSCTSGTWTTVKDGLPASADFVSAYGHLRLLLSDGTSSDYWGTLGAVRSGTGEITVNRVGLDQYTQGVVPREMPASWQAAAVQAQAIAARTYAEYEREHASGSYDICDTTSCQVYGGANHFDSSGNLLYSEDPAAVSGNAGQILRYNNAAAFTQFSASNGGWTVYGGQPYLPAKADPYDNAGTGDPYIHWTASVPVSQIASAYGFARVTQIAMQRDGNGEWGGRVTGATIYGIRSDGSSGSTTDTGFGLQDALGLLHNWFTILGSAPATLGATVVHSTSTSASVFYRNAGDNTLLGRTYVSGSGWQPTFNLGAPASGLTWDPDAASWGNGHIDVVARDGGGHLVVDALNSGTWGGWRTTPVTTTINSSPTATSPTLNETDVFYLLPNHQLGMAVWANGWQTPTTIPGVTNANSGPDATSLVQTDHSVVVAYRGTDGRYWTVTRTNGTWGAPAVVNPTRALPAAPMLVDPSADNSGNGNPSVYYTGTDGVVYHAALTPSTGTWSAWYAVPGSGTTSAPDVWSDSDSHGDLVSGHTGVIGTQSWSRSTGWRAWAALL